MLRKDNRAVPEGCGPIPRQEESGPDQPTLVYIYRLFEERLDRKMKIMKSCFDQHEKKLNELIEMI